MMLFKDLKTGKTVGLATVQREMRRIYEEGINVNVTAWLFSHYRMM